MPPVRPPRSHPTNRASLRRVALPIGDRQGRDAELLGDLSLKQSKIEAALSQVIAKCFQCVRIGGIEWLGADESEVTEWQRR